MTYFEYKDCPVTIREDIKQAHRQYWDKLAAPGCWWTGIERAAIAQEVRNANTCQYCADRKQSLSPYQFEGQHHSSGVLGKIALDAVHRITTDQARITQDYVNNNTNSGLSNEAYVELAGVVVNVFSIDEFNRALGLDLEPLPEPVPGEPSHYRPAQAVSGTGFVPMIPPDGATGAESDLWSKERTGNVLRALSLVPDALREWLEVFAAQYLPIAGMTNMFKHEDRAINRMQMELVASRVSALNQCFY